MAFEVVKERMAQMEQSVIVLKNIVTMDGLEWEHRVAIIDGTIALENQINDTKSFLEKHDVVW